MSINIDSLIKTASAKLGMPEDKLREAVKSGNAAEIMQYMSSSDREKLGNAMKDRKFTESVKKQYMNKQ